jgi:hypothetical protein
VRLPLEAASTAKRRKGLFRDMFCTVHASSSLSRLSLEAKTGTNGNIRCLKTSSKALAESRLNRGWVRNISAALVVRPTGLEAAEYDELEIDEGSVSEYREEDELSAGIDVPDVVECLVDGKKLDMFVSSSDWLSANASR